MSIEGNYSQLINTTLSSHRQCIQGHVFFDVAKEAWFEIIRSRFVFIDFEYSFGTRWNRNHHEVLEVKRCSAKMTSHIMECNKHVFAQLKA